MRSKLMTLIPAALGVRRNPDDRQSNLLTNRNAEQIESLDASRTIDAWQDLLRSVVCECHRDEQRIGSSLFVLPSVVISTFHGSSLKPAPSALLSAIGGFVVNGNPE